MLDPRVQMPRLCVRHIPCREQLTQTIRIGEGAGRGAMAHLRSAGVASTSAPDVAWHPSRRAGRGPLRVAAVASPDVIFKPPGAADVPKGLNKFSQTVTQHKSQGASLAQLYGTGLRDEDRDKPQVVLFPPTPSVPAHACARMSRDATDDTVTCSLHCGGERVVSLSQVGISSVWYEGNTCNMHLNDLAAEVSILPPPLLNTVTCTLKPVARATEGSHGALSTPRRRLALHAA